MFINDCSPHLKSTDNILFVYCIFFRVSVVELSEVLVGRGSEW